MADRAELEIVALSASVPRTALAGAPAAPAERIEALLDSWFPGRIGALVGRTSLRAAVEPHLDTACAGMFGDTIVLCAQDLTELTDLSSLIGREQAGHSIFRIQLTLEPDGVAFDVLQASGEPVRELLVVAGEGVVYDEGPRLDFEQPFWSGPDRAAAADDTEMPFDPMAFGDAAMRALFGFSPDGPPRPGDLDPDRVELCCFDVSSAAAGSAISGEFPVVPVAPQPSTQSTARPLPRVDPGQDDAARSGGAATPAEEVPTGHRPSWWKRLWSSLFG